jgi:hypothetical protein
MYSPHVPGTRSRLTMRCDTNPKPYTLLGLFYPHVKHFEETNSQDLDDPESRQGGGWRKAYSFHQIARVHVASGAQRYALHVALDSGDLYSYSFVEAENTPSRCAFVFLAWVAYVSNIHFQPQEKRSRQYGSLPIMVDHLSFPHSMELNLLPMRPRTTRTTSRPVHQSSQ